MPSLPPFFFFQAEDGIRDVAVTGVQTCALPILTASDCGPWTLTVTPGGADLYLNVPGTISGSTTGAGDDCNSSSGPDQVVQLNVPVGGIYTLSLCESAAPGAW